MAWRTEYGERANQFAQTLLRDLLNKVFKAEFKRYLAIALDQVMK
jgi:hypothetical protein